MARSLSASLATALGRDEHSPAIKVKSSSLSGTIPFDGNSLGFTEEQPWKPYMITHSNGNIIIAMRDHTVDYLMDDFIFIVINTETSEIEKTIISGMEVGIDYKIDAIALVEKSDGNVGIIIARYGYLDSTGNIYRATVSPTGSVLESPTSIGTYSRATSGVYGLTGLSIDLFSNGTYYLVYCYTTVDDFYLYKLTSSNWSSWTGPTAISHGLTSENREIEGVFIFETAENDCFLMFSYTDTVVEDNSIFNIYSMLSTDYGSTWGSPSARTAYTEYGNSAYSPVLAQKSDGGLFLVFYERNNVLRMEDDALGWQDSSSYACPAGFNVKTIYYNSSTGHITCSYGRVTYGIKCVCGVLVIDASSWQIIDNFNEYSSPAVNGLFLDSQCNPLSFESAHGSKFIAGVSSSTLEIAIMLLDVEERSIDYIVIDSSLSSTRYGSYGLYPTIEFPTSNFPSATYPPYYIAITLSEPTPERIYLLARRDYLGDGYWILYIDLDDLTELNCSGKKGEGWDRYELYQLCSIRALSNEQYVILGSGGLLDYGAVAVHNYTGSAAIATWTKTLSAGFPLHGCYNSKPSYCNGHIYFNILYDNGALYVNQRGLCDLNVATGEITYIRPSWASVDDYYLYGDYYIDISNTYIWIAPQGAVEPGSPDSYVVAARYNISTGEWTTYTRLSIPGMPNAYAGTTGQNITLDEENGNVIIGLGIVGAGPTINGVLMFNMSNSFTQVRYLTATKNGSWIWEDHDDIDDLVTSTTSSNPAITVDTDDILWAVWDNLDFSTNLYTPYWDRDLGEVLLADYLVGELRMRWELKKPNELRFSLSHGNLFDPENSYSILRNVVEKGRQIVVEMGEYYYGEAYYENQGVFIVHEAKIEYSLRAYPIIKVKAKSKSSIWQEQHIISTALYSTSPEALLTGVLTGHAQLSDGDYNIPTFDNTHIIEHQFVDINVWDAVEEIADHWFYNPYDDMDGIFTMVKLDLDKTIDHIYSSNNKLIEFTPDTSHSDFTNSVRVIGETADYVDVLYEEELIDTLAGTIGWWENTKTRTVRYSKDGSNERKCRNPRLHVVQSISFQAPLLDAMDNGEGGEYISEVDVNEQYCIVTIDVPDLTSFLAASMTALAIAISSSIACDIEFVCGAAIVATTLAIVLVLYTLMAMANYQYEVYANPIGEEKLSVQYIANDTTHQRNLDGRIVQRDIDDPFCYSVADCSRIAVGNLDIVKAQRRRVCFKKVAHMRDELLDKIRVAHPYSGEVMDIIIVGLTRTYKKGADNLSGMYDEIEGWRII